MVDELEEDALHDAQLARMREHIKNGTDMTPEELATEIARARRAGGSAHRFWLPLTKEQVLANDAEERYSRMMNGVMDLIFGQRQG